MSYSQNPYYSNIGGSAGGGGFVSPYDSQNSPGDSSRASTSPFMDLETYLTRETGTENKSTLTASTDHPSNAQRATGAWGGKFHRGWDRNWTGMFQAYVTVVAQVAEPVNPQSTNMLFRIDDGTGRMDARHWLEQHESPDMFAGITEGSYIRVLGTLKQINNKRHLNAPHIRLASAKEFLFHKCEVMLVWSQITLGLSPGNAAGGGGVMESGSAYVPDSHQADTSKYDHLPPLEHAIIRYMQSAPPRSEGVNITAIAKNLNLDRAVTAADIDTAMIHLMDGGMAYTTIDDSHFALAT